jgi:hypothetical protein
MDAIALDTTIETYLTDVRSKLEKGLRIAKAAELCAGSGRTRKGMEIVLSLERISVMLAIELKTQIGRSLGKGTSARPRDRYDLRFLLQLFYENGISEQIAFKDGTTLRKMIFGARALCLDVTIAPMSLRKTLKTIFQMHSPSVWQLRR